MSQNISDPSRRIFLLMVWESQQKTSKADGVALAKELSSEGGFGGTESLIAFCSDCAALGLLGYTTDCREVWLTNEGLAFIGK